MHVTKKNNYSYYNEKNRALKRLNTDRTDRVTSYPTLIIQTYLLFIYNFVQVGYRVKPRKL